jgi:hypothetical protein
VKLFISEFSASSYLNPFCSYPPSKYPNLHTALWSVPKLRVRLKSYPSLDRKNLKTKISLMLPIMATAKKIENYQRDRSVIPKGNYDYTRNNERRP